MMYASGIPLKEIAEKFNRPKTAIQKLISDMGVHRGDNICDPVQEQAQVVDQQEEKKGSALKKPWYLQKQIAKSTASNLG